MIRRLAFILALIGSSLFTLAQQYTISGTITEAGSRELLPGVSIYEADLKIGTTTNKYGFYSLTLPAGEYRIIYSFIGYKVDTLMINLNADTTYNASLGDAPNAIGEVKVVAARKVEESKKVQMSSIDIPIQQIKDIPTFLGEKDVLKTIQLMPGVQSGSEGQSGIYVRGGGPDQNLIILDDAVVYNASHLFGFFSLFNGDALKSVELIKGGFPARYGGRLSSVIDMSMKEGNREKYTGELGIGIISSRGVFEGPIPGLKGKGSFVIAARRTYIDILAQPLIFAASGGETFGYFFHDFNAKLNYDLSEKDRLYLSGYFGKDKFYYRYSFDDLTEKGNLGWGNYTTTLRWNRLMNKKMFSNTSFVLSKFDLGINAETETDDDVFELNFGSSIRDLTLKYDLDYFHSPQHSIKTGAVVTYHQFNPNAVVIKGTDFPTIEGDNITNAFESGIYIEDTYKPIDVWKINGGLRISHFYQGEVNYINPEPRLSMAYLLTNSFSLKASYAMMNQYIHLLSNTGLGLPTDLWVPTTNRVKPQRSQQVAIGVAKDIAKGNFSITLEAYYKTMNNILGYKEGSSFLAPEFDGNGVSFGDWQDKVTAGEGESYGAELFIQKKYGAFSGWIGYTLSWTTLQYDDLNNGKPFYAKYDRRHDISLVGIYKISDRVKISGVWVYGTGNAISLATTTSKGVAYQEYFGSNILDYRSVYNYGEKNSHRMRAYHRLDLGLQLSKTTAKGNERTFEFSVYNAYSRSNPFFYMAIVDDPDDNWQTDNSERNLYQISLFPILPSISWSLKFN
ncbi:TonB-dependent receptor [bacterium]|nr:TonB-dependent receptor [bacterium]